MLFFLAIGFPQFLSRSLEERIHPIWTCFLNGWSRASHHYSLGVDRSAWDFSRKIFNGAKDTRAHRFRARNSLLTKLISARKEYLIATLLLLPLLLLSIPTFGIPLLFAAIFYLFVGGLWNKITKIFIKSILPLYATIFGGGKKFLIRFSEYTMPPTDTCPNCLEQLGN